MGKCAKCGKKILYNNFTVVDGIVYHRECAPVDQEVVKAEKEAEEQFQTTMKGHGSTGLATTFVSNALEKTLEDAKNLDFSKMLEPTPKAKKAMKKQGIKTPRKKRSKKVKK